MSPRVRHAIDHLHAGRLAEAEPLLRAALADDPGDRGAIEMLGRCLTGLKRYDEAEGFVLRWIELDDDARGWAYLAQVRYLRQDRAGSHAAALRALTHPRPGLEDFRSALEGLLHLDDYATAAVYAQAALRAARADADLRLKLVSALAALGQAAAATALAEQSLPLAPATPELATSAAATALYASDDATALKAAHDRAGLAVVRAAPSFPRRSSASSVPPLTPATAGTPRVVILSPDLRRHSVAYFLEPLIRHHEATGLDLVFVSTADKPDAVTDRLRALSREDGRERWLDVPHTDAAGVLAAIERAGPDVLIECAGHTVGHSLHLLAQRRARVQLSYCGYAHDTGLPSLDARLSDALADPPVAGTGSSGGGAEPARVRHIEGCFLAYAPPGDAPPVGWSPPGPSRPLTLGSFNLPSKLSDHTLVLWSRVMAALPEARLRLKLRGAEWPATAEAHRRRLAAAGVPVDRVDLLGLTRDHTHHLSAYDALDLALDTFPYHGTTTTCEALLMGVPVITRAGACHHSRVGVSLLSAVGLPELIARDDDAYVGLAVSLARDPARLAAYRSTLRARLLASPLADQRGFAVRFGATLRRITAVR